MTCKFWQNNISTKQEKTVKGNKLTLERTWPS